MTQSSRLSPRTPVQSAQSSRRRDALAVLALCLLATILFADVLFGARSLYVRDLTRSFRPTKQILREVVQHGEFPYWNRYYSAGQPLAANPEHEVFYPPTWLILLPSYDLGFRLELILHLWIGLAAMYAFLRSLQLRMESAFLGALAFGLGGLSLSYLNLPPILFSVAWLPLTCLYARRFLLHRRARDFALASLVLGLQILIGEPTTLLQTGFLIGMYALYRGWYDRPRLAAMARHVFSVALLVGCAMVAGAAQLLPALDLTGESARARPFKFEVVTAWSMPWTKLLETVYPNLLGHITTGNATWYWGVPGRGWPFLFSIYSGVLIAALAAGGLLARARGARFVLLLTGFSALAAAGVHTPAARWLYDAGILTSTRFPEKWILIAVFSLIVFAAQMFDRMLQGDERPGRIATAILLGSAGLALLLAAFTFSPTYAGAFRRFWGGVPVRAVPHMIALSRVDWTVAAIRGAVFAALLAGVRRGRRQAWLAALGIALWIDLGWIGTEVSPRMPRHFFDPPPVAATFPADRTAFRLFHEADWYGRDAVARQYFPGSGAGADFWILRNGLFPVTPAAAGLQTVMERDFTMTTLLPTVDFVDSVWKVQRARRPGWPEPFLAMSNAWYVGDYPTAAVKPEPASRTAQDATERSPIVFTETAHYERYWFATALVPIADRADFVLKLSTGTYSTAAVFVAPPVFAPAAGLVTAVHETANTARLEVESFGRAFLYLSVTPDKHWRVELDGRRVTPVIANIGYQGLEVPAGRHVVTMRYRNDLVRAGGAASIVAILVLAGIARAGARGVRVKRRKD
jgi:hypothetical protein